MNNNELSYIEKLAEILKDSNNIVFFGGAGMSTESGIPDFRSANGLYSEKLNINFTPEQLVSHSFYVKYPKEFFNFYKEKLIYPNAKPNAGHNALAKLEKMGKLKAIVTQNIDGLHQAAGSKNVYELHGSVLRNYCTKCHSFYDEKFILDSKDIPTCPKCGGIVKPDVVLYEEGLDEATIQGAIRAISQADTLIIGGTSLVVYPAAGLIDYFRGRNLVLINKSTTPADSKANLLINDDISKVLTEAINNL
ncbi:NAD-dependent deacetylase [Clostridium moniliforme]|uniref:NAD-dependent protein deacetylase n=1 Tax=Clostridium moniliforme TaxID=39489 RepID=A0ABS4F3L2_9CLOT|nr:NAD-dependent protein deacylase [Clostridium moniliforme]MBP1890826.1 NAD-dependent deacetylase [Clostridium moniliforme]